MKIPNDMAARALAADAGVTRADYFDAGLTQPIPNGVLAGPAPGTVNHLTLAGLHPAIFANDIKSTYSDEWLGGVEFEVARNVSLGVRYINRKIPVVMEDYAPAQVLLYGREGSIEYLVDNIDPVARDLEPRQLRRDLRPGPLSRAPSTSTRRSRRPSTGRSRTTGR